MLMKKQLRLSLLSLALMLVGNVMAEEITIDFDNDYATLFPTITGISSNESHDGDFTQTTTSTEVKGITVTVAPADDAKTPSRIWGSSPRLRMYSGTFTVSGKDITKIVFDASSNFNISTTTGTLSEKTWTGKADAVEFSVSKNTQLKSIVVTIGEGGGEEPDPDTPSDPTLTGKGTLESPYTVADALTVTGKLEADEISASDYYIKGKISSIKFTFSAQYGTATFNISDDGKAENEFTAYGVYALENKAWVEGNTQVAVGDEVIVCGKVTNYKGTTLETANKQAYVYSINGKTKDESGEQPEPQVTKISVAEALTAINALADGAKSENSFIVKGYIVGAPDFQRKADGSLYGNVNFAIADEKGGTTTLTVFRAKNFENANFDEETISSLKEGDLVEVQGLLQKYVKDDVTTPELVSGYLISVNGSEEAPEQPETAITVADALTAISALADGAKSADEYVVKGYIVGAPDFQRKADGSLYGNVNCTIADEKGGTATLTIFRAKNFENANFDEETISSLKEGDLVEFKGLLQKYVKEDVTTPELVSGYLVSINGKDAASVKALKLDQNTNAPAYNLSGQQVSGSYRGLVIKNGRKFMIK